jgi:hypothetical protein
MRETGASTGKGGLTARGRAELVLAPLAAGVLIVVAFVGLIGTAIKNPQPHDIPVGLVGPAAAVQQFEGSFGAAVPGAFRFTTYDSEQDARTAVDDRDVDGALILGSGGPHLIVAGAVGDTLEGVITGAFTAAFKAQNVPLSVEIVHPFGANDAHGLVLFFVVVATLIGTLAAQGAIFAGARKSGLGLRLGLVAGSGVLISLAGMGTATWVVGDYGDGFWAATALVALASMATGAFVAGAARLLGVAGIGLSVLVVVLLDLVSSGGPVGSQMLPDFYRYLAPWMPADQLYSGMRGALYFSGAGVGQPALVLTGWLVAGLALMVAGEQVAGRRRRLNPASAGAA